MLSTLQYSALERDGFSRTPEFVVPPSQPGKLAYLTSQYPKVSHTFIRREIEALERQGWEIVRLSIRGWNAELVDPDDIKELSRTNFALKGGALPLLAAVLRELVRAPRRLFAAFHLALNAIGRSDRPALWHLIYLAEACWFAGVLREQGISHVHVHFGSNPAEVAMLINALTGLSYSFTVHGPEEFDRARAIRLDEKVRRAAFVAVISSYSRSQLFRAADPADWAKIKVVRCGVPQDYAKGPVVPCVEPRLVCVGRLCEQKGQLLLIQAAATLAAEGRRFKLVLVGDGDDRSAIEYLIARHGLGERVEITGWANAARVRDEMLKARALVLPSFAEGLPIVLMEAMLLGRPVLTTYIAGIPELVMPGDSGWLFPAGSEEDLVAAMRACLDAPAERLAAMGEKGRERVAALHDLDRQASQLSALFQSVFQKVTAG